MGNLYYRSLKTSAGKAGTAASRMPQVPLELRRKRARELRELGKKIYLSELKKQTFFEHEVLIENDYGIGKTENNFNIVKKNAVIKKTLGEEVKTNYKCL